MFTILHWDGTGDDLVNDQQLEELVAELDWAPKGYREVSLVDDETEWLISAFRNGHVMLYNPRLDSPMMHMTNVDILATWALFRSGGIDEVVKLPWQPGAPPPQPEDPQADPSDEPADPDL